MTIVLMFSLVFVGFFAGCCVMDMCKTRYYDKLIDEIYEENLKINKDWQDAVVRYMERKNKEKMTERKFTEKQIIKALECCASLNGCAECPYRDKEYKSSTDNCGYNSTKDALDLITQQKAEIDILIRKHDSLLDEIAEKDAKIERVKSCLEFYLDNNEEMGVVFIPKFVVEKRIKEMTEGKDE